MDVPQKSLWRGAEKQRDYAPLDGSLEADVAIVGGGMTGVTAAYLLRRSGMRVVLVEKETLGSSATALTTAFLIESVDTDPSTLISIFGTDAAKRVIASHRRAIDFFGHTVQEEGIDCDFMYCPAFLYARSERDGELLVKEAKEMEKLGMDASFKKDGSLPFTNFGYIRLERQAKFHPLKYLYALAEAAARNGVQLFEHTNVTEMQVGDPVTLKTDRGKIRAHHVLVATHYPAIGDAQPSSLFFRKARYISYVLEARLPRNSLPEGLYEDTENPYHYLRADRLPDGDRLILGGDDHRADIPVDEEKSFAALEEYLTELRAGMPYTLVRRWKGPIIEPGDGLAYIGPADANKNVVYATGYSGNGMTYSAIAAEIFRATVLGRKNEWAALYDAQRPAHPKPLLVKAKDYITEFLFGAVKNTFKAP